uniref:Uncharacterized protein n=1 Tax=Arundo donax TaxID=35708 RepID=A0A0A9EHF7_ARUDO
MLHAFISRGADVSSLLLPSWHKIQKLIDTLGGKRGPECAREMRELAAYIVVHLAGDIHLAQFPGAIQCISSLLQSETTWMYWNSNQQGLPHPQSEPPPKKQAMILRLQKVEQKKEAWRHGQVMKKHDGDHRMEEVDNSSGNGGGGGGSNKLILLGLSILKRLASDHQNCNEICSTPGILPKITAPLYSDTLVQDIRISAWADVVNETFQVLVRLVRDPGESSKRLVQDISSNKHAVSNLEKILDENSIAGPGMQMRAMNILTALASDSSSNLARETKENLMKKQLQTFLADEGVEELEATCNPNKATAGGALAFLSTNSETNSAFIMSGYDDILGRLTDKLDPKNNNIYRIIAADILGNLCAHCALDKERVKETLLFARKIMCGYSRSWRSRQIEQAVLTQAITI